MLITNKHTKERNRSSIRTDNWKIEKNEAVLIQECMITEDIQVYAKNEKKGSRIF